MFQRYTPHPRRRSLLLALLLAAAVVLPLPGVASAQGNQARAGQQAKGRSAKRAELRKKMRALRHKLLRRHVGLSEAKAQKVEAELKGFRSKRRALRRQLRQARGELRRLLKANSNDEAAYKKALGKLRSAHDSLHELRKQQIDAVSKHLTYKQRAKLLQGMMRLRRRLHRGRRHR